MLINQLVSDVGYLNMENRFSSFVFPDLASHLSDKHDRCIKFVSEGT